MSVKIVRYEIFCIKMMLFGSFPIVQLLYFQAKVSIIRLLCSLVIIWHNLVLHRQIVNSIDIVFVNISGVYNAFKDLSIEFVFVVY